MAWDDLPPNASSGKAWDEDPPPEKGGGDYWGDVRKNAWEGAKEIPGGALAVADTASKAADLTNPVSWARSGAQLMRGKPATETPVGEDISAVGGFAKQVPPALFSTAKTLAKTAVAPLQMFGGTPAKETMIGEQFRERPLSTAADLSVLYPAGRAAIAAGRSAFAGPGANILERAGTSGMAEASGLTAGTVKKMTPKIANPSDVGYDLNMRMAKEGVLTSDPAKTFDNALAKKNEYGKKVGKALQDIKTANRSLGEFPDIEDSLKVQATPILKPILDEANKMAKSGYDDASAANLKRMYDNLATKSNENNGFLTLEHVDDEMEHVGKMFNNAARDSDKWKQASNLYGKLADIRDSMVSDIAEKSGNPALKQNLLDANKGYSTYTRVLPDFRNAAAKGPVKGPSILAPVKMAVPAINRTLYKAGRGARRLFEESPVSLKDKRGAIFPEDEKPIKPEILPSMEDQGLKPYTADQFVADSEGQWTREDALRIIKQDIKENPSNAGKYDPKDVMEALGGKPKNILKAAPQNPADLPVKPARVKEGPLHALYAYDDNFGPGGSKRQIYNVYGDPGDPRVGKVGGWGTSVPKEKLDELGIPVIGREPARDMNKFMEEKRKLFGH